MGYPTVGRCPHVLHREAEGATGLLISYGLTCRREVVAARLRASIDVLRRGYARRNYVAPSLSFLSLNSARRSLSSDRCARLMSVITRKNKRRRKNYYLFRRRRGDMTPLRAPRNRGRGQLLVPAHDSGWVVAGGWMAGGGVADGVNMQVSRST